MNIDPAELRRRNTIPPQAMPYKTPLTFTYDSGRFEENLDRTMKLADWAGFDARRRGGGAARHAARHRHLQHHRAGRRSHLRDRRNPLRSARRADLGDRLDLARPGSRHRADADPGGPAGRRSATGEVHPGRHRRGGLRHGHRRLALDHHERRRHRSGQRQDHRQGQEACRASPGGRRRRHRVQGRPLHHRRHRPRHGHPRAGASRVPAGEAAGRHGARPL